MNDLEEGLISAPKLCKRLDIVGMTLWRHERDPRLNFPQPIKINGRKFYKKSEIDAWERVQAARRAVRAYAADTAVA